MKAGIEKVGCAPVQRRAVIDIGTNSVKLLVADIEGAQARPVFEHGEQTRLGLGFFETRILQPGPLAKTAAAVAGYARKAVELGATITRVIATSAARDALNREELTSLVHGASGLPVEVITGDQEASYAFTGALSGSAVPAGSTLVLDVGGGSTEFVLGEGTRMKFRHSLKLGTVRLFEQRPPADPPTLENLSGFRASAKSLIEGEPADSLRGQLNPGTRLIGTGGTPAILARVHLQLGSWEPARIEANPLSLGDILSLREKLWTLPLAERRMLPGLPPDRADVILAGVVIFETVMEVFGFETLTISTRGLRFGALLETQPVA